MRVKCLPRPKKNTTHRSWLICMWTHVDLFVFQNILTDLSHQCLIESKVKQHFTVVRIKIVPPDKTDEEENKEKKSSRDYSLDVTPISHK